MLINPEVSPTSLGDGNSKDEIEKKEEGSEGFEIKPEYKTVLDKVRAIYKECGGNLHKLEGGRFSPYSKSKEGLEIPFDNGIPQGLYTPDGRYSLRLVEHSSSEEFSNKFWELFNKEFEVKIIEPAKKYSEHSIEGQGGSYGPRVRIEVREERKE